MVIDLLPVSSKYTNLLDFMVKKALGPLNTFPFLVGIKLLSVEGTEEKLKEERVLLSGSGVFTESSWRTRGFFSASLDSA